MTDEIKVLTRTSEIDPRRQPPDSELLRQIKDRFASSVNKETNQLLRSPDSILQPMNRVQKYLQKLPFSPNKAIWQFINYLVQYGVLIMTDDPTRRYFFDDGQLDELTRAGQYREVPQIKHDIRQRLKSFIAKADKSKTGVHPLSPAEVKALVTGDLFDLLKEMAKEHPEIENLIQSFGDMMQTCLSADPTKTQNAIAEFALTIEDSLRCVINRVESQSLELVTAIASASPDSTGQTPAASQERNHSATQTRLIELAGNITKWQSQLDRLRREQNLVEHYLSDVKLHVLEEELNPRLNFAEAEDLKKIELAIERAHAKADELNEHIEKLLKLQAPIDARIRELQRLQSALKICAGQEKEWPTLAVSDLPARPTYDADELLDWQSVDLSEEMTTTLMTDLTAFTADEKLLIAAFQVIGQKTSGSKMARALFSLGLAGTQPERERELRQVCRSISEKEPPPIRYTGCASRYAIYMHSGSVVIGNVKAIIPENKQSELLAMFQKPTPEPETD